MYLRYLLLLFALSDSCWGCQKNHRSDVDVEEPREPIDITLKLDCPFRSDTWRTLADIKYDTPTVSLLESKYKRYIKKDDPNKCCDVTCSLNTSPETLEQSNATQEGVENASTTATANEM
ncbi:uncharacterized protein LOC124291136 [Haliotis rubra]|uniref:uncharacterized protein LOC124291136 n=1 Tax=Haliotis rubra TaxID=36100 RepID=UPI001EE5D0F3|nr:uncharacterized protein LOC124291136 [Haliotis rubra]